MRSRRLRLGSSALSLSALLVVACAQEVGPGEGGVERASSGVQKAVDSPAGPSPVYNVMFDCEAHGHCTIPGSGGQWLGHRTFAGFSGATTYLWYAGGAVVAELRIAPQAAGGGQVKAGPPPADTQALLTTLQVTCGVAPDDIILDQRCRTGNCPRPGDAVAMIYSASGPPGGTGSIPCHRCTRATLADGTIYFDIPEDQVTADPSDVPYAFADGTSDHIPNTIAGRVVQPGGVTAFSAPAPAPLP